MKLGFAIKVVSAGSGEPLSFNKGQWIKKVVDKRDYLKLFSGFIGTNNKLTFLSFEEDGCFLTILKSIPGRDGDHVSAWIYVPNVVDITGEQLVSVYNFASGILDETNISERQDEIDNFFSTSFHDKEKTVKNTPTNGEKFGIRYIDKEPLTELLGENRYQQYYSAYKAIFLLPQNEAKVVGGQFENLTGQPLRTYCILEAPTRSQLQILGPNVTLCFENGTVYDKDFTVQKGATIKLVAKRKGFNDVSLDPFQVVQPVHKLQITQSVAWNAFITDAIFKVKNVDGEPIHNVKIDIDGHPLSFRGILVPENKLQQTTYSIKAPDYEESTGLLSANLQDIHVTLHRKIRHRGMSIVLANGSVADFEIKTRGSQAYKGDDFIKGYTYDTERHAYDLDWWFVWKQRLLGMLYAVIIALAFVAYISFDAWWDSHEFQFGWPPFKEIRNEKASTPWDTANDDGDADGLSHEDSLAVKYLDSVDVWNKDSLDSYTLTQGLYDILNEFRFSYFEDSQAKLINASTNMRKVSDAIKTSRDKNLNPMEGKEKFGGNYNDVNDKKIKLSGYIDWITREHKSSGSTENIDTYTDKIKEEKASEKTTSPITGKSSKKTQTETSKSDKKDVSTKATDSDATKSTKKRGGV